MITSTTVMVMVASTTVMVMAMVIDDGVDGNGEMGKAMIMTLTMAIARVESYQIVTYLSHSRSLLDLNICLFSLKKNQACPCLLSKINNILDKTFL